MSTLSLSSIPHVIASFIAFVASALGIGQAVPADVTVPDTAIQITQDNDEAIDGPWYASDVWERATISFSPESNSQELADNEVQVGYSPDCNSGGGIGAWEGEQFILDDVVSTDIACTPSELRLSEWLNPIVLDGAEIHLDESAEVLYISSEEGTAAFEREHAIGAPSVELSS